MRVTLSEESRRRLDSWVAAVNQDFSDGHVTHSDVLEHVLAGASPNIEQIRREHIDVTKFVIRVARSGVELPALIAQLQGLASLKKRKPARAAGDTESAE